MRLASRFVALCLVGACSAACAYAGQALSADESPVRVSSLTIPPVEKSGEAPFRLKFRVQNVSNEAIRQIEFEAMTQDSTGQILGFRGFPVKANLNPGEEQLFHYSTRDQTLGPDETVQLAVTRVSGFRQQWDVEALRKSDPLRVGGSISLSQIQKAGPADPCDTRCGTKETVCESNCQCGVDTFSCSCSTATFSYSCKCYRCN